MVFNAAFSRTLASVLETVKTTCEMDKIHACSDAAGRLVISKKIQTYNFIFFDGA